MLGDVHGSILGSTASRAHFTGRCLHIAMNVPTRLKRQSTCMLVEKGREKGSGDQPCEMENACLRPSNVENGDAMVDNEEPLAKFPPPLLCSHRSGLKHSCEPRGLSPWDRAPRGDLFHGDKPRGSLCHTYPRAVYVNRLLRAPHVANLPQQPALREGLLKERHTIVEDTVPNDRVIGVSRQKKHLHVRPESRQLLRDPGATHFGHHDIGDHQL